ncbi:uncharacterized protein LOC115756666 [Rhodamnia argentea]|uniref:Uncharacterized protein LOC115756666 n=1 Tax=Rhodamnia argentea TaxID=178133 RepID=A0A8B8QYU7_9MYRT|nr:uncharacterized protein LOC115756666 [Rhodamnia argentea]
MASSGGIFVLLALCVLFSTGFTQSEARELRPSDHGLQCQDPPPAGAKPSPEMASFFGASPPPSPSSSDSSASSSPAMTIPTAANSSNNPWLRGGGYGGSVEGRRGRRSHVRGALLVASIVCGITGVALLFASGMLCLFKFRKDRSVAAVAAPPPSLLRPPLPLRPPLASGPSGDYRK